MTYDSWNRSSKLRRDCLRVSVYVLSFVDCAFSAGNHLLNERLVYSCCSSKCSLEYHLCGFLHCQESSWHSIHHPRWPHDHRHSVQPRPLHLWWSTRISSLHIYIFVREVWLVTYTTCSLELLSDTPIRCPYPRIRDFYRLLVWLKPDLAQVHSFL